MKNCTFCLGHEKKQQQQRHSAKNLHTNRFLPLKCQSTARRQAHQSIEQPETRTTRTFGYRVAWQLFIIITIAIVVVVIVVVIVMVG